MLILKKEDSIENIFVMGKSQVDNNLFAEFCLLFWFTCLETASLMYLLIIYIYMFW